MIPIPMIVDQEPVLKTSWKPASSLEDDNKMKFLFWVVPTYRPGAGIRCYGCTTVVRSAVSYQDRQLNQLCERCGEGGGG